MKRELRCCNRGQMLLNPVVLKTLVPLVLIFAGVIGILIMKAYGSGAVALGVGILIGGFGGSGELSYGLLKVVGPVGFIIMIVGFILIWSGF